MISRVAFFHFDHPALQEAFGQLGCEVLARASAADVRDAHLCLVSMKFAAKNPLAMSLLRRPKNGPLIGVDRDGPSHMGEKPWRLAWLRRWSVMDAYATHSLQDAGGFARDVLYLPNAAWHTRYHLNGRSLASLRDRAAYRYDVSFFGELDAARMPEMARRQEFFAALAPRLESLGISTLFTAGKLSPEAQLELIQSSRINLNFHAGCDTRWPGGWRGQPPSWGLPERCYGIPAAGGFLLSDTRVHGVDDFGSAAWSSFDDLDDCVAQIRYYLAHFDELRDRAELAHQRVLADHTYEQRAQRLVDYVRYWRAMRNV